MKRWRMEDAIAGEIGRLGQALLGGDGDEEWGRAGHA
jgi:hypothetical protein